MWAHPAAVVHRHHPMGTAVVVAAGPCFSLLWDRKVFQGKQGWGFGDTHNWHPHYLGEGTDSPGVAGQWAAAGHRDLWPQDQDLWAPGSTLMLQPAVPDFLEGWMKPTKKDSVGSWLCDAPCEGRAEDGNKNHCINSGELCLGVLQKKQHHVTLSKRLNKHLWWMKYELQSRSVWIRRKKKRKKGKKKHSFKEE